MARELKLLARQTRRQRHRGATSHLGDVIAFVKAHAFDDHPPATFRRPLSPVAVRHRLAGLPGIGKSSLGRELARRAGALYLRIDTIEWALAEAGRLVDDDPSGYMVGYAVAEDNLRLGSRVVADSVNPLAITRSAWRQVAADAGVASADIEVICSDTDEHRRRVESRGLEHQTRRAPTWQQVRDREYEPWQTQRFVIDTAGQSAAQCAEALVTQLAAEGLL